MRAGPLRAGEYDQQAYRGRQTDRRTGADRQTDTHVFVELEADLVAIVDVAYIPPRRSPTEGLILCVMGATELA